MRARNFYFLKISSSAAIVYETNESRLEKYTSQNNNFSGISNAIFAESKDFWGYIATYKR